MNKLSFFRSLYMCYVVRSLEWCRETLARACSLYGGMQVWKYMKTQKSMERWGVFDRICGLCFICHLYLLNGGWSFGGLVYSLSVLHSSRYGTKVYTCFLSLWMYFSVVLSQRAADCLAQVRCTGRQKEHHVVCYKPSPCCNNNRRKLVARIGYTSSYSLFDPRDLKTRS